MSASHDASTDATSPAPLETTPNRRASQRTRVGLNLFWRTFFLLALLLVGSILAWLQTLRALEFEPRTLQTAQQIASLVNLSRAALVHADAIARVSLIKTMADQEGVRILPREPSDRFDLVDDTALGVRLTEELTERLGPGTIVAGSVNGESGLWVGFTINGDPNWLLMDRSRLSTAGGKTWLIWLITAAALSLAGAAAIARLINRPLKQLSYAANRVRDGDFAASQARRGSGDQRDPRGEHRLQPHGAEARETRAGPGGDAGRHLARPAHPAGAAAAGNRDERDRRRGPRAHGGRHRAGSTPPSTSSWTTRGRTTSPSRR